MADEVAETAAAVAKVKASAADSLRADVLAYTALGALVLFGLLAIIVAIQWPDAHEAQSVCALIIGYLLKEVSAIYSFKFGSSQTSKVKDETIAELSKPS